MSGPVDTTRILQMHADGVPVGNICHSLQCTRQVVERVIGETESPGQHTIAQAHELALSDRDALVSLARLQVETAIRATQRLNEMLGASTRADGSQLLTDEPPATLLRAAVQLSSEARANARAFTGLLSIETETTGVPERWTEIGNMPEEEQEALLAEQLDMFASANACRAQGGA